MSSYITKHHLKTQSYEVLIKVIWAGIQDSGCLKTFHNNYV